MTTPTFVPTAGQISAMSTTDFVRVAWHHSLHFETHEITNWAELEDVLGTLNLAEGAYGDLMPHMGALGDVFADLSGITVAREFSECLYAFVPYWTHQRTGALDRSQGRHLTPAERFDIASRFLAVVRSADELSVLGHRANEPVEIEWKGSFDNAAPYRIRAWWD